MTKPCYNTIKILYTNINVAVDNGILQLINVVSKIRYLVYAITYLSLLFDLYLTCVQLNMPLILALKYAKVFLWLCSGK